MRAKPGWVHLNPSTYRLGLTFPFDQLTVGCEPLDNSDEGFQLRTTRIFYQLRTGRMGERSGSVRLTR